MATKPMEFHGDISGGWMGEDFPWDSQASQTTTEISGVAYGDRGVDLGTKNAGIVQFLSKENMPVPREKQDCLDSAQCLGACDGHVSVYDYSTEPTQENQPHSLTLEAMGQLALFEV